MCAHAHACVGYFFLAGRGQLHIVTSVQDDHLIDVVAHEQRICDKSVAENSITTSDGQVKQITRDDDKEDAPSSTAKLNEEWGEDVKKSHALSSAFLALKEKPDYMMVIRIPF